MTDENHFKDWRTPDKRSSLDFSTRVPSSTRIVTDGSDLNELATRARKANEDRAQWSLLSSSKDQSDKTSPFQEKFTPQQLNIASPALAQLQKPERMYIDREQKYIVDKENLKSQTLEMTGTLFEETCVKIQMPNALPAEGFNLGGVTEESTTEIESVFQTPEVLECRTIKRERPELFQREIESPLLLDDDDDEQSEKEGEEAAPRICYIDPRSYECETIREGTEELNLTTEFNKALRELSTLELTNQVADGPARREAESVKRLHVKAMQARYHSDAPFNERSPEAENMPPAPPLNQRAPLSAPAPALSSDDDDLADVPDSDEESSPNRTPGHKGSPSKKEFFDPAFASPNRNYLTKEPRTSVPMESTSMKADQVIDLSGGKGRYNFNHPDPSPREELQESAFYSQPEFVEKDRGRSNQLPGFAPNGSVTERIRDIYGTRVASNTRRNAADKLTNPAYSIGSRTSQARSPERRSVGVRRQVQSVRHSPLRETSSSRGVSSSEVHQRLYDHSKHLEEKKHLKKITQHIYDETADLKEVRAKPAVNTNSEKFAKRKEMYRLGSEPIQNALYRDFIYREKRKQDELNQVQAQVQAETNRQKTNSKSYKLALKKLEKDLQQVFADCELDHNGQLGFSDVGLIVARLGIFKVHGNPEGTRKLQIKARQLAEGIPEQILKEQVLDVEGGNQIMAIAAASDKKAAANALLAMEQRRQREEELHVQLWRYLNPYDNDKIQSLVLMELFKVILCQFTQNVRELAATVNDLMNIAHQGSQQDEESNFEQQADDFTRRQAASTGYPQEVPTESESNESIRQPVRSANQEPTPEQVAIGMMQGQLSGIPEETVGTNAQGSVIGSGMDHMSQPESPYINHQRMTTGMSGGGMSNVPQWSIEDILREIKALNEGTLIFKRPARKQAFSATETSEAKEAEGLTFQPKINARSKMVKSKFRSETHTPLKAQPPKEGDSEKKAATEGPKPKQMHRRVNTDIHNRLLEVRTEYQKKKEMKREQIESEVMTKCTFKPSINNKSKKIESRFKTPNQRQTAAPPKDAKVAAFGGGGITAADLLGKKERPESPLKKVQTKKEAELPQFGEYLQCTFKPELVSNFKKKSLQKKVEVRGIDGAAKRMREAHESREKTKQYLESLKLGTQYEKNKQRKFCAPNLKTQERANKSAPQPIILLDVNVGPGKTGRLVLHKGQELEQAANEFAHIYHLSDFMKQNLLKMLSEQFDEYTKEQQQQRQQQPAT